MKYITAILFMFFLANTAYTQTYKNVWEVPDAVQMGYKGKVKKVIMITYNIKTINGKAMQDTLEENIIDSFDINGFLQYRKDLKYNTTTIYTYANNKLDHAILYAKGVKTRFDAYRYTNPRKIISDNYEYDKDGNKNNLRHEVSTTVLNKANKIDTVYTCTENVNGCMKIAYVYVDRTAKEEYLDWVGNGEYILSCVNKTLLSDSNLNPVEVIRTFAIYTSIWKANYTYEYYE